MKKLYYNLYLLLLLTAATTWRCQDAEESAVPILHAVTPALPAIGDTVTITGENFAMNVQNNLVYINGKVALQYVSGSATRLQVIVPPGALSGDVMVRANYRPSNTLHLDVFKRDVQLISVTPNNTGEAPVGSVVEIRGQNFLPDDLLAGKASIRFASANGRIAATLLSVAEDVLQVVVPDGISTGPIELWQEGFVYTGPVFTLSLPELYTLSAQQVREGDILSFTGKSLLLAYQYRLGGVPAIPESYSDTDNAFRIPAGLEPGIYPIEFNFQGSWYPFSQTVEVLPWQNVVKIIYWERFGRLCKTSIDAEGQYHHAYIGVTGGPAFTYNADKQQLYFFETNDYTIYAATPAGKASILYTTDVGVAADMVADDGRLYWSDANTRCLKISPDNGTGAVTYNYCDNASFASGIDVLDGYVYWVDANNNSLMRATADGAGTAETITLTGATPGSLQDVEVVNVNGQVQVYLAAYPAGGDVYAYTGTMTGTTVALKPFTSLTPDTGAPYNIRRINVDRARRKVIWGNNYGATRGLWESNLDGSNPTLLLSDDQADFHQAVVIEN